MGGKKIVFHLFQRMKEADLFYLLIRLFSCLLVDSI
jgi:hypothetical protein